MVLEVLMDPKKILKDSKRLLFWVTVMSFLGMGTAYFLFPKQLGVMSVAFISLLLFPLLNKVFTCSAKNEFSNSKISFLQIIKQHSPLFRIFFIIMVGVFIAFFVIGLTHSPDRASSLFSEQLSFVENGLDGVSFDFNAIAQNNLKVLYVTFGISLIYGAGVILMLSWNASVWGIIIGSTMRNGLLTTNSSFLAYISTKLIQILPHMILESFGYLGAAISGGLLAMCIVFQRIRSKRFLYTLTDVFSILVISILLIFISAFIEINI